MDPRPRILVVSEGIATEPGYFADFSHDLRAVVSLILDDEGGSPKTLVERAVREKRNAELAARRSGDGSSRFAEIWCVFDIDQHPLVPEAKLQAQVHGIKLAVSNPCFELWLLLHFQDQTAYIDRRNAQSLCRSYMPKYDKRAEFESLRPRYTNAVARAQDLARRNKLDGEAEKNPSTGVYVLTEFIRLLGREAFIQKVRTARQR